MSTLAAFWDQSYPPKPPLTEANLQDLTGKVLFITGGYSGVGYQLTKLVYRNNATVYIAGHRESNARQAIAEIKADCPDAQGKLEFIHLDLADLASVKACAEEFLRKEKQLHVLWNNAGVMGTPSTARTKQGYELLMGANCFGPFLLAKLLQPILANTAKCSPDAAVRVIWLTSIVVHLQTPKGGLDLDNLDYKKKPESDSMRYALSKTGVVFLAKEWARRSTEAGVVHLSMNPGNLKTPLQRNMGSIERQITNLMLHHPIHGAYTELFAGLSSDIAKEDSGRFVIPWGRFGSLRADIEAETKTQAGKGASKAARFFEYCGRETNRYA